MGGPMKRNATWNSVIGTSLDSIPASQLPTVHTILRRYRALRIENEQDKTIILAKMLMDEVSKIWDKAYEPIASYDNCVKRIQDTIYMWKSCHSPADLSDKA